MENASKALLIAAAVLIGVMLLSTMVYLFMNFGNFSSTTYSKIEQAQLDQFNIKFLQYTGSTLQIDDWGNEKTVDVLCTTHDIISLANLARQNNINQGSQEDRADKEYNESIDYIQISVERSDYLRNLSFRSR